MGNKQKNTDTQSKQKRTEILRDALLDNDVTGALAIMQDGPIHVQKVLNPNHLALNSGTPDEVKRLIRGLEDHTSFGTREADSLQAAAVRYNGPSTFELLVEIGTPPSADIVCDIASRNDNELFERIINRWPEALPEADRLIQNIYDQWHRVVDGIKGEQVFQIETNERDQILALILKNIDPAGDNQAVNWALDCLAQSNNYDLGELGYDQPRINALKL